MAEESVCCWSWDWARATAAAAASCERRVKESSGTTSPEAAWGPGGVAKVREESIFGS